MVRELTKPGPQGGQGPRRRRPQGRCSRRSPRRTPRRPRPTSRPSAPSSRSSSAGRWRCGSGEGPVERIRAGRRPAAGRPSAPRHPSPGAWATSTRPRKGGLGRPAPPLRSPRRVAGAALAPGDASGGWPGAEASIRPKAGAAGRADRTRCPGGRAPETLDDSDRRPLPFPQPRGDPRRLGRAVDSAEPPIGSAVAVGQLSFRCSLLRNLRASVPVAAPPAPAPEESAWPLVRRPVSATRSPTCDEPLDLPDLIAIQREQLRVVPQRGPGRDLPGHQPDQGLLRDPPARAGVRPRRRGPAPAAEVLGGGVQGEGHDLLGARSSCGPGS